ncbi:unnamed protein product, partial [Laminaria digitata]
QRSRRSQSPTAPPVPLGHRDVGLVGFFGGPQPPQGMAVAGEATEAPVPEPMLPPSSGTPPRVPQPVSPRPAVPPPAEAATATAAAATATAATATAATAARTARAPAFVIPPWRGAARGNSATAAARTRAAVANRPDTPIPPPTTTASEAARPSPVSTTDERPTLEEPREMESRRARVRACVIPPWREASRDNRTTAETAEAAAATDTTAAAAVVNRTDTITPPSATTASEAARPSPVSRTDARPTLEEPRAVDSRTTTMRTFVIPPWRGASRDNRTTAE